MIRITLTGIALCIACVGAGAAEPVVGRWKVTHGEIATIAPCGDAYCITLVNGKFAGQQIGRMSGSGGSYAGEITDPNAEKTYSGSATVAGSSLTLTGCALKIFCRSQTWARQ